MESNCTKFLTVQKSFEPKLEQLRVTTTKNHKNGQNVSVYIWVYLYLFTINNLSKDVNTSTI